MKHHHMLLLYGQKSGSQISSSLYHVFFTLEIQREYDLSIDIQQMENFGLKVEKQVDLEL